MTRPTRATVDGRAYLDLRARAKEQSRPVDEYLTLYALEGFLDRLSKSQHHSQFILKGGVLLAALNERRPTRDVDLAAIDIDNVSDNVNRIMIDIASISIDDGLAIDTANVTAEMIRDESADYAGVRVSFAATLATAQVNFHVDINVGDPVEPEPTITSVPRILGGSIEVLGYPVEMVIAEKLVTAIQRGTANTRWRDFVDMHRITGSHPMSGKQLIKSTMAVADYRDATLAPLGDVLHDFGAIAQAKWKTWRVKQKLEGMVPENIDDLLTTLNGFADPIIDGTAATQSWNPASRTWHQISQGDAE